MWLVLSLTSAETAGAATSVVAERLVRAEKLKDDLEYEAARQELLDVIADPRATEEELLRAHMSAGEIARVMERDVDARMHFLYVLSRKPDTVMPDDRPPKIRTFFELLRQEVRDRDARDAALVARPVEPAPAPSSTEESPSTPFLAIAGGGVVALGVVGLGAALVLAAFGELTYADKTRPVDERKIGGSLAILGWGLLALASIPVVGGGGLVFIDLLME
jgi:hypothetical protein